jgi:hypothetical protein
MMRTVTALALAACFAAGSAWADERDVAITVYNNDLGLVKDIREIEIEKGISEISFAEVASRIDPTSVHLSIEGGAAEVLEQNYEYDLISTSKLLEKALDGQIEVYTEDDRFFDGVLLASDSQNLVLKKEDGGINVIGREQVVHVALPDLADGLVTRPTLKWLLSGRSSGEKAVEVDYLTGGIQWHAEYVGVVDDEDRNLDFSGWVSVDNKSGATYPDAELKLVAGDVRRVQPERPTLKRDFLEMAAPTAEAGFQEEAFFEYHLYTLPRPTTIRDRQIKQITLFPSTTARITKKFKYDGSRHPKDVRVELELKNDKASGLGMALPAGKVRMYKRDSSGSLQFIGEDRIDHTPKDEKLDLYIGNAFDIVGERSVVESRRITDRAREETYEITLRNHKEDDVEVIVIEHLWGTWRILDSNFSYEEKDAFTVEFPIRVKSDEEVKLTYKVRLGR